MTTINISKEARLALLIYMLDEEKRSLARWRARVVEAEKEYYNALRRFEDVEKALYALEVQP